MPATKARTEAEGSAREQAGHHAVLSGAAREPAGAEPSVAGAHPSDLRSADMAGCPVGSVVGNGQMTPER